MRYPLRAFYKRIEKERDRNKGQGEERRQKTTSKKKKTRKEGNQNNDGREEENDTIFMTSQSIFFLFFPLLSLPFLFFSFFLSLFFLFFSFQLFPLLSFLHSILYLISLCFTTSIETAVSLCRFNFPFISFVLLLPFCLGLLLFRLPLLFLILALALF